MASLEQQLAQKQAEIARLKNKMKRESDGQKIIIGGMMLAAARDNANFSNQLLSLIDKHVTRDSDKKRLESVIADLKKTASQPYETRI